MDLRPYLDELERFADGHLSEAEQEAFEQRLDQEPELAAAHAAYEQLTADLRWAAGHEALRHRLTALERRLGERDTALTHLQARVLLRQRRATRWLALGLGLSLLLAGLAWWLLRPSPAHPSTDWRSYYQPDPALKPTAAFEGRQPLLNDALQQYQDGHYPAALHTLARVSPAKVDPDTLSYFRGVFLLHQDQGLAAQPYLRRVSEQPANPLAGAARYHLGMAHWQAQDLPQARTLLHEVAIDSANTFRAAARRAEQAGVLQETP